MDLDGSISVSPASAFPCVITCLDRGRHPSAAAFARAHLPALLALLTARGALLFRGFALPDAPAFSSFVGAFGFTDLPYEDSLSLAVRTPVAPRVCTTNDGRSGGLVFHHEQAAAPRFPSKLFFFCEAPAPPGTGGGTGLSPSWLLLEKLAAAHPGFIADCEARGVRYRLTLPAEQDARTGVGRSWRSFFAVASAAECEARMAALGYSHSWGTGGVLHLVSPVLAPVRAVPGPRGPATRVFFNQIVAQIIGNAKEFEAQAASGGAPFIEFGDGGALPLEPVRFAFEAAEAASADVAWQQGDVALLDNYLVMHARRPWAGEGPRRVLASLCV